MEITNLNQQYKEARIKLERLVQQNKSANKEGRERPDLVREIMSTRRLVNMLKPLVKK